MSIHFMEVWEVTKYGSGDVVEDIYSDYKPIVLPGDDECYMSSCEDSFSTKRVTDSISTGVHKLQDIPNTIDGMEVYIDNEKKQ